MFTRIMAMVISAMLLMTVGIAAVSAISMRTQQINSRLEALTKEARDIAYLAARSNTSTAALMMGIDDEAERYLQWKSEMVYRDYNAYIVVVDRRGRIMDNLNMASLEDPNFASSLNGKELSEALIKVVGGEEISLRSNVGGNPTFTVGVPFVRSDTVLGAVLIHTGAQTIEGGMEELFLPVFLVSSLAMLAVGGALFFYIRRVLKPLRELTAASRAMSEGDFSVRVDPGRGTREVQEMASAFNIMADKVSENDASRREFVANVSHELRSPITSISGFVQGILDGTIPEEERMKYLGLVGDETRRLTRLISDLLALSRLERDDAALDRRAFDMCEMFRRAVIRRVNDLEKKNMEVDCEFSEDPCMVIGDPDRIEQVVVNLLDNAIKFTPDGGTVTLEIQPQGSKCCMVVRDNGIGISEEDRGRVFERFFTVDRAHTSGKGTGLGLSICQRIMQMHGESIRLLDTQSGAAFAFTLPRAGDNALPAAEEKGEA